MASLKDVANLAKVSVSTVSKVLNGKGRVSETKRKEILGIARQLGYTPNYHARTMAHKTKILTIGLIVPDIINPFFARLTRGVQKACGEDTLVILMDSFRNLDREEKLIRNARFFGINGIIVGNSRVSDDLVEEISSYIPVVVFDKYYELENVVSIVLDNNYGAYMATKHLIENGCKHIVHLGGTHELYVSLERARGYESAVGEAGFKPLVQSVGYNESAGYQGMKRLLDMGEKVDGVFCMNDLVAIGAMRVIKEKGLRIPQDIAVIGFDNDEELCEIMNPPLSSVHQPVEEMGEVAAKLLFELIKGNSKIKRYVFTPRLVVRQSSLRGGA